MSIQVRIVEGGAHASIITSHCEVANSQLKQAGYACASHGDDMLIWIVPLSCVEWPAEETLESRTQTWIEFGDDPFGKITVETVYKLHEDDLNFGQPVKQLLFDEDEEINPW